MCLAEVSGHVDLGYAIQIADRSVHHQSASFRRFGQIVEEIVADDGAVIGLAEEVDHQHIARLNHVDRHLIVDSFFGVDHRIEVGP